MDDTDESLAENEPALAFTAEELKTGLLRAAKQNDVEQAEKLLEVETIDVNQSDSRGFTPLIWASAVGAKQIVGLLLRRNADIQAVTNNGDTALHWACYKGHAEVVTLLLAAGADIQRPGEGGATPLHCAVSGEHAEIVKLLLMRGVDTTCKNMYVLSTTCTE